MAENAEPSTVPVSTSLSGARQPRALVRTVLDVVVDEAPRAVPKEDHDTVRILVLTFGRDVGFAAAEVYARAAEARGELLVGPGTEVYAGMIVGIYNRQEDIEINVCKAKHLTNMRSKSSDGTVQLTPFTQFSLEQCIDFIEDDELLEVTPKSLRLRKRYLDANERKRASKK